MAGTVVIGPRNRNPDYALGENQWARIKGNDTLVLVAAGGGSIHSVNVGVAGVLAKFYDTPSGGTADDSTEICTIDTSAPTTEGPTILDVIFAKGLTVITTGANTDLIVSFRGAPTVSTRTFGTL